jgi:hypothetical protein
LKATSAEALQAYIAAACNGDDKKGWLFRTAKGHLGTALAEKPMDQASAWRMVRRRAYRRRQGADRQPQFSGDRDHGLPRQWRHAGARAGDGGAREPAHDEAL